MKRTFSVTLAFLLLLLLSGNALAASVSLQAGTLEGGNGSAVDVPVTMTGANGLGALQWELVFDPAVLTYDSVTRGTQAGNALVEGRSDTPGRLFIALASVDDLKGDGPVAVARFKVVGATGASSNLTIENANAWEGVSHRAVQVNAQAGKFTVGGLPWWLLYALIALAIILLLLILFLLLRRRKKPQPTPVPVYPQPAPNYYAPPPQYQQPPPTGQYPTNQSSGPYGTPQTGPYPPMQRPSGPPPQAGPYPPGQGQGPQPQPQMIYCRSCGTPNPPTVTHCRNCQRPMN